MTDAEFRKTRKRIDRFVERWRHILWLSQWTIDRVAGCGIARAAQGKGSGKGDGMSASKRHWRHIGGKGTYKPRTAHQSRFLLPWTRGGFYRRAPFRPDWFTPGNNGSISVSRRLILNMQDARAAFWRSRGIWLPEGVMHD